MRANEKVEKKSKKVEESLGILTKDRVLVDELGSLLDRIKELEVRAKGLKEELIKEGDGVYEGYLYTSQVTTSIIPEYNKDKLAKKLGFAKYKEVSKVSATELKKYISLIELQNYIDSFKEVPKVTVKKKEEL